MGVVKAVCISEKRGTKKINVHKANFIKNYGIENDAHADSNWHRQVSLLSYEKISDFRKRGADINYGDFGENIVVEGFDFNKFPIGTMFKCGDVILELTQIGKKCHSHCEIFKQMGECIMPRNGVFAKVINEGIISEGDEFYCIKQP